MPWLAPLLLLAATAAEPGCGPDVASLLADLDRARLASGAGPLRTHPALCATAAERLATIAREGFADQDVGAINRRTRSLYRRGYAAHAWSEAAIVGGGDEPLLEQFRAVRPDWYREALTGDFEEVGAALSQLDGRPICAILLALPRRTVAWRQAAPLGDRDRVREEILAAVNDLRATAGRPPLRLSQRLSAAAQAHAEDMLRRGYYAHLSPEGAGPGARARAAGYDPGRAIAENIAKGPFTPAEVVERWLASSDHRRNILRRGAVEMGAGVAFGENADGFEVIWVQLFGGG